MTVGVGERQLLSILSPVFIHLLFSFPFMALAPLGNLKSFTSHSTPAPNTLYQSKRFSLR